MPPAPTRQDILHAFGLDDPFTDFPLDDHPADFLGWNSNHRYLVEATTTAPSPVVVDVGVWKGGSTVTMARALQRAGGGVVIAVDTFLGSAEHLAFEEWRPSLRRTHGWPNLYYTFVGNCIRNEVCDVVVPLPIDSLNASELLRRAGIHPTVVHLDAGHDYRSVRLDLDAWWQLLLPGGVMICDDYPEFPGVTQAVDEFVASHEIVDFAAEDGKCRFTRPVIADHGQQGGHVSTP